MTVNVGGDLIVFAVDDLSNRKKEETRQEDSMAWHEKNERVKIESEEVDDTVLTFAISMPRRFRTTMPVPIPAKKSATLQRRLSCCPLSIRLTKALKGCTTFSMYFSCVNGTLKGSVSRNDIEGLSKG
jgi:hypothetical protein